MSDVATGAGDSDGRRRQRPLTEHAGEVTRKKALKNGDDTTATAEPPPSTGSKIGGAGHLLRRPAAVLPFDGIGASTGSFVEIGGVHVHLKDADTQNKSCDRSLAAPSEWRRYWGSLTYGQRHDWDGHPDVHVSSFCYGCHQSSIPCSVEPMTFCKYHRDHDACSMQLKDTEAVKIVCRACGSSRKCQFVISYRRHPDEDWDVTRVPEYSMRQHARNWQIARTTSMAITTMPKAYQSLPPVTNHDTITAEPKQSIAIVRRTTIAQQLERYSDLAEIRTKDSYHPQVPHLTRRYPDFPLRNFDYPQRPPPDRGYFVDQSRSYAPMIARGRDHHPLFADTPMPAGISKSFPPMPADTHMPAGVSKTFPPIPAHVPSQFFHPRVARQEKGYSEIERKHESWQLGRVEKWCSDEAGVEVLEEIEVLTFAASESFFGQLRLKPIRDINTTLPAYVRTLSHESVPPTSRFVPPGLILYATDGEPNSYFKWRPCLWLDKEICGFYLLEVTGMELYYIINPDQVPGHSISGSGSIPRPVTDGMPPEARYKEELFHVRTSRRFFFRRGFVRNDDNNNHDDDEDHDDEDHDDDGDD